MKIVNLSIENSSATVVTDNARPRVSFAIASDKRDVVLADAVISIGDRSVHTQCQTGVEYDGTPLKPFTEYTATVTATDNHGESDTASISFRTGRLGTPWQAKWITDTSYRFTEKRVSPVPMTFRKAFRSDKKIAHAEIYATALGTYNVYVNGKKVGDRYFAPGFTSYKTTLQYQAYDVTELVREGDNELSAVVAGGWAVGAFVFTRKNRVTADRQALLAELRLTYADGSTETIGSDVSWQVTRDGNYRMCDFYDGETYDATVELDKAVWRNAGVEKVKIRPNITAEFGSPVVAIERLKPISCVKRGDELIYDFGQNFAGVIAAEINGARGQTVVFRHAEILKDDGSLYVELLRSAKATATYICRDGAQSYSPEFTYMGFRYVGVRGIEQADIELTALVLSSDIPSIGEFSCSDERIDKLQENILRSARSNFMDIPTDCPQRDERMGWTGDISVFAPTACFNYDMSRCLEKWLNDVKAEQLRTGGIPNTVPVQGYGFPATMPVMAVDNWGDACITVPYAEYLARGDIRLLAKMYPTMKKYVEACRKWASFMSVGKRRYIWKSISMLHFGDWLAPDEPKMSGWQKRHPWTATASLCRTSGLLSRIAELLGKSDDARRYGKLSRKVADAYVSVFTDGNGKLKNEFQTAYVLPLAFGMFDKTTAAKAADNLEKLVERNEYKIGTGFPGTPFILFALADNGKVDTAFKMLTNDECPSWLYEVKAGGTTVWERWDAMTNKGGQDGTGGMISFNHYASGAVGEFLYKRVAGIEPTSAGYKTFKVGPLVGGGITHAHGAVLTPYGKITSDWEINGDKFELKIGVPPCTTCNVVLPSGETKTMGSGEYSLGCALSYGGEE